MVKIFKFSQKKVKNRLIYRFRDQLLTNCLRTMKKYVSVGDHYDSR